MSNNAVRCFQVAPAQRGNAFVPRRSADLDRIFSLQFERAVQRDNTVSFQNLSLQIEKVRWRGTLAGCQVVVHQHLDGTLSLTHGPHCLGRFTSQGATLATTHMPAQRAVEKKRAGKVIPPTFPIALGNPAKCAGFPLSHRPDDCCCCLTETGQITCYKKRTL